MSDFLSLNNKVLGISEGQITPLSSFAFYGKAVFTTLAIIDHNPFLWKKHWGRLTFNAAKLSIDLENFSEAATLNAFNEIIVKNNVANGRSRITFLDESPSKIWSSDIGRRSSLLITTAANRKISNNFRLTASPHRINTTSPLAGIKSCNYLEHLMTFEEAKARGFDEAVRLNERGEVASACMANIFWIKDRKLHTPRLTTGCLAGTTREFILENIECEEVEAGEEAIGAADDIFLTSAGIGVVQVAEFAGRTMVRQPHKILDIVPKPI